MRRAATVILLTVSALLGGCRGTTEREVAALPGDIERGAPTAPQSPRPKSVGRVALQVYEIELPPGSFTEGEAIWRRLDEQVLDVAAQDVLWANGLRVGVAPVSQLSWLAKRLGTEEAPQTTILSGSEGPQVHEIDRGFGQTQGVGRQTIFWFDAAKRHHGRTFDRCQNLLKLEFGPAVGRRDEAVRLSLTPTIRSTRGRQSVRADGSDYIIRSVYDEALLDLNLAVDVAYGEFVLITPSPDAMRQTSVGRHFLLREDAGQLKETAYLILPQRRTLVPQR